MASPPKAELQNRAIILMQTATRGTNCQLPHAPVEESDLTVSCKQGLGPIFVTGLLIRQREWLQPRHVGFDSGLM